MSYMYNYKLIILKYTSISVQNLYDDRNKQNRLLIEHKISLFCLI